MKTNSPCGGLLNSAVTGQPHDGLFGFGLEEKLDQSTVSVLVAVFMCLFDRHILHLYFLRRLTQAG